MLKDKSKFLLHEMNSSEITSNLTFFLTLVGSAIQKINFYKSIPRVMLIIVYPIARSNIKPKAHFLSFKNIASHKLYALY